MSVVRLKDLNTLTIIDNQTNGNQKIQLPTNSATETTLQSIEDNQINGNQKVQILNSLDLGDQIMYNSNDKLDLILQELQQLNKTLKKIYQ